MSGSILGAPNLTVIDAITQFLGGGQAVWDSVTIPVPSGLVVYATDTTAVKIGDGSTLYANLPVWFLLSDVGTLASQVAELTTQLAAIPSTVNLSLYAPLNSPEFIGTPQAPTQASSDNSVNLATTAYVDRAVAAVALEAGAGVTTAELTGYITTALGTYEATAAPLMDGTAAVGASTLFARQDHVHPTDTSRVAAIPTTWDVATPPGSDVLLAVGQTAKITFENVTQVPLSIQTQPGIYEVLLVITGTNTVNSDWYLKPNNANYTNAFFQTSVLVTDQTVASLGTSTTQAGTAPLLSWPYIGDIPMIGITQSSAFFFDLFAGPNTSGSDTINDIGPSIQRWTISTYTNSKMIMGGSGIAGGPGSSFGRWGDNTTLWTSLGTFYDVGGNSGRTVNATISGVALVKRMA